MHVAAEVAHSLDHLRMNPDNRIAIYNVTFLRYSAHLQWSESALCHRYYFGLPDHIQDIISTCEGGKPSTFQALYSTAVSIDNHFWEWKRESERASHSTPQYSSYQECSKSGTISHQSATSAPFSTPQHVLSSESSDSDSVLSFSTSGSIPGVPESSVKLESLIDSRSRLGSNLSSESLFQVFYFCQPIFGYFLVSVPPVLFCSLFFSQPGSVSVLSGTSILFCVPQISSGYTMIIIVQSSAPVYVFRVITTSGEFPLLFP